jgi:hypothetical protein
MTESTTWEALSRKRGRGMKRAELPELVAEKLGFTLEARIRDRKDA